ncbi:unnamed protein product [Paramecium sonneborni]|uniref:Uncharacterized protein n=1 Tax=Paramecium sonneborni TaxID=65129 RepID=A0A8S1RSV9_9CILI|nr:unnamed protein product [Paramecium sonneborni]
MQQNKRDINIQELLGGGIGVPKSQQIILVVLETHLYGDEFMAFGAVFHASANLIHLFIVRTILLTHGCGFKSSIEVNEVNEDDCHKEFLLFEYKQKFESTSQMEFSYDKHFKLDILNLNQFHISQKNYITNATGLNFNKPEFLLHSFQFHLDLLNKKLKKLTHEVKPNITLTNIASQAKLELKKGDIYEEQVLQAETTQKMKNKNFLNNKLKIPSQLIILLRIMLYQV